MFAFSLDQIFKAKENDNLKSWVIDFLAGDGNNRKLANTIRDTTPIQVELIEYPLIELIRIAGPEENMKFREDKTVWEKRVQSFQESLNKGCELPPLIVTNFWNDLHISDGAHRHEALIRNGTKKYWTIFLKK